MLWLLVMFIPLTSAVGPKGLFGALEANQRSASDGFYADGVRPKPHSVDGPANNLGYYPDNYRRQASANTVQFQRNGNGNFGQDPRGQKVIPVDGRVMCTGTDHWSGNRMTVKGADRIEMDDDLHKGKYERARAAEGWGAKGKQRGEDFNSKQDANAYDVLRVGGNRRAGYGVHDTNGYFHNQDLAYKRQREFAEDNRLARAGLHGMKTNNGAFQFNELW